MPVQSTVPTKNSIGTARTEFVHPTPVSTYDDRRHFGGRAMHGTVKCGHSGTFEKRPRRRCR